MKTISNKAAPQSSAPHAALDAALSVTVYDHARDNRGTRERLRDWPDFCGALRHLLASATAPDKTNLPAIGPHTLRRGSTRAAANVDAVTLAALDIDRELPDVGELLEALHHYGLAAIVHASPSDPAPESRRVRIYMPVSRPIEPGECGHVRRALGQALGVTVDRSTLDPSRLFFVGRLKGTPAREVWETEGEPVDVDDLLETYPEEPTRSETRSALPRDMGRELSEEDHATCAHLIELVEPHYDLGRRNALALALGGYLRNAGFPIAAAEYVLSQLPSDDVGARVRDAERAWGKENPAGWAALEDLLPAEIMRELDQLPQGGRLGVLAAHATARQARRAAERLPPANDDDDGAGNDPSVDHVIQHLAAPRAGVYQRAGQLVRVTRDAIEDSSGLVRPAGSPTIRVLPPARLGEIIAMTAGAKLAALGPQVIARGEWEGVRPLDAIVSYPVLRRDGSLLSSSGYDPATRTLAEISIAVDLPDEPTREDARAALTELSALVCDFPFAGPAHSASWIAALLTPLARPAIEGPTPMLLLDASQRGSGKTLLADVISIVVTGSEAPRRTAPETAEEWRKVIYAMLLAGDPIALVDNVTRMLSSAALDAMLTGTTYSDRVLGVSEERRVAVRTMMIATTNNARVSTDLVRRSLACRLEPDVEHPERRAGWQIPDLLGHVRQHRARLLSAALTILRAYAVAGRPAVEARTMGSYGAWCRVVRDAIVWAGAADPAATQDELRESADVERDELRDVLATWHAHPLLGERPVTVRELLDVALGQATGSTTGEQIRAQRDAAAAGSALLDALRGLMPDGREPTTHTVGNALRRARGQIVGGLVLREGQRAHGGRARYSVLRVGRDGRTGRTGRT